MNEGDASEIEALLVPPRRGVVVSCPWPWGCRAFGGCCALQGFGGRGGGGAAAGVNGGASATHHEWLMPHPYLAAIVCQELGYTAVPWSCRTSLDFTMSESCGGSMLADISSGTATTSRALFA
jgi:hypothetical protein